MDGGIAGEWPRGRERNQSGWGGCGRGILRGRQRRLSEGGECGIREEGGVCVGEETGT